MFLSAVLASILAAVFFVCFSFLINRFLMSQQHGWFKAVLVALLTIVFFPVQAQSQWSGWPSDDENDGKFVAITGPLSAIEYLPPKIIIGLPSTAKKYDIEVFDGDASAMVSSRYDINTSSAGYTYTLYQDPGKDGTGSSIVTSRKDTDFPNDDWGSYIANQPVDADAQGEGGLYWYRLEFVFNGDPDTEQFFNALKIRVRTDTDIKSRIGALKDVIIGASPINGLLDPGLNVSENTYEGEWIFDVEVTQDNVPNVRFTDADADFGGDASSPGQPPDDNILRPQFRIFPSIRYELFAPTGEFITFNTDPSGDEEEETYVYTPPANTPAGFYRWHWTGADASNIFILRTDYIIYTVSDDPPASLGNYVWLDENSNGLQDVGEPGLAGVRVMLKDATGSVVSNRITDEQGGYMFDRLEPGRYTVAIDDSTLPIGVTQTDNPILAGADFGNQSSPYSVDLSPSEVNLTADFGYVYADPDGNQGPGALGDKVWIDTNGNGRQDAGEAGLGGVELTVYTDTSADGVIEPGVDSPFNAAIDSQGNTGTGSTTTNSDGSYIFNDLPADSYVVVVNPATLPDGFKQTADPDEFAMSASAADNQTTSPVVLGPGDVFLNVDFGYQPDTALVNSIGDTIFLDLNANAAEDAGEPGISGVTLSLFNGSGEPVASSTTDSDGKYLFEGLPDGDYSVLVSDENGALSTFKPSADPDSQLDGRSRLNVTGGESNLDQDFGYISNRHNVGEGLIGDTVFFDRNVDGNPNLGEGLESVTVQLFDAAGLEPVAETVTGPNGFYLFGDLDSRSTYTVKVDTTTLPSGLVNTVDPDGGNDSESSINLAADPDGTNDGINLDQDFGYVIDTVNQTPGTIGDTVWLDANADGVNAGALGADGIAGTDDDEPGIEGVTLDLYLDTNGDGQLQSDEPRVNSTVTDNTGRYLFDQLLGGDYIVDVSDDAGLLNGYWHSLGDADTNDQSQSDPYAVNLPDGGAVVTADFGYYYELASVGDFVWFDVNANGLQDSGELGIASVTATLTIDYPDGSQSLLTTVTDSTGFYSFDNLLADEDYNGNTADGSDEPILIIKVETPAALLVSPQDQGSDDSIDSDNGQGELAQPVMGGIDDTNDFGFYQASLGTISGNVSSDINGQVDPIAGVTLSLYLDLNKDGVADSNTPIKVVTTDADGNYLFTGIEPGDYVVEETDPDGYTSLSDGDNSFDVGEDAPNEDPNDNRIPVSVGTDSGTLTTENDQDNDFVDTTPLASLGDRVWLDANADGVQDAAETSIAGVSVILIDSSGNALDTVTTDADGLYAFTGLLPGSYTVSVDASTLPASLTQTFDLDDGLTPSPATPNSVSVSLAAGEANNNLDFGYQSLGTLGDTVWNDSNANGILDAGETGIAGVEVSLSGPVSGTMTTDADGNYEFTDLPQGNYTVSVAGSALDGLEQTHDLDDPATVTPTTAYSTVVVLDSSAPSRDDADFGFREPIQLGSIGDTIWNDSNANGILDTGEPGIDGVTVTLFDATGNEVGSQVTSNGGKYLFEDLPAGDYTVVVSGRPIDGLTQTYDLDDGVTPSPTTPNSASVSLAAGEANNNLDFGYQSLSSITGTVLEDSTGDAIGNRALLDNNGQPLTVMLALFEADAAGNPVAQALVLTTANPATGFYQFTGLQPGNYVVVQTQPSGFMSVLDFDESADGDSFDADINTDDRIAVTIMPGELVDDSNNFVEQRLGSISGWVSVDTNGSGYGNTPLSGIVLDLLDSAGNIIATTTTAASGGYSFNQLPPGDYTVVQTQPSGYSSVKDRDNQTGDFGDPDPQDSDDTVDNAIGVNLKPGEKDWGNSFVEFTQSPAVDIRKQSEGDDVRTFVEGDTVDFEIQVTNTGAIELTNVAVTDPLLPACNNDIGTLGLNESVIYSCSMVLESAQGFINVAQVSAHGGGQTVTDSDPSEVRIEESCDCDKGQKQVSLQISEWNENRDETEIIRVHEGGRNGPVVFEGQVLNNGTFAFDLSNPGATIVITVQGTTSHLEEFIKGKFVTNCALQVGKTNGNNYITFKVTDLVADVQIGVCPASPDEQSPKLINHPLQF